MKRILITGASGFIGSFLVEEALKNGFEVYAGIRNTSKQKWLNEKGINLFLMDLSSMQSLKERFTQMRCEGECFDYIIHSAGLTKTCKTKEFEEVNYQYTRNLIEALIESNCTPQKFIFISSLAAYGPGNDKEIIPIENFNKPNPLSKYGKSKLKAEQYLKSLNDFSYLIFRPTGVYGPREVDYYQVYKSINMGLEFYVGSKDQYLSFVHVDDLCQLIINALGSEHQQKAYFVSDLRNYTSEEFNRILKRELNKKTISIVFPKSIIKVISFIAEKLGCLFGTVPTLNSEKYYEVSSKNWWVNSRNLEEDFNYSPQYKLHQGLKQTLQWYKAEKWL